METNKLEKILANPENIYRGRPFWCWNGKIDEKECRRQIDCIKEMGFGGFFIHSRVGLETEYMGEEWFSLIKKCIGFAKQKNLEVWLYDEDRWPSGTCGGKVTENPGYRLRFVSEYDSDEEAFDCKEVVGVLKRYAVKLNDKNELTDCYEVCNKSRVKAGYRYLVYAEEMMKNSDFYNGFTYLDTMNGDAVKKFFELTHEKYYERLGSFFGNGLKGIFTDEPHRGAAFTGFGIENRNYRRMIPYTGALPGAYQKKYHRELVFPEIYYSRKGRDFNESAYNYIDVADDLFINNYAVYYGKWCRDHNIISTGHILHEDSLSIQTSLSGSMMRYYANMDYPGIDHLAEPNKCFWIVKQCSSVAHQLDKPFVLSEIYGCTGWSMTLERYKYMGDWQALFGITFRCPHLAWYTMRGESKRDYPASIFCQNAWYKDWKIIEDYYGRLSYIMTRGQQLTDTLVVHPVEQMWGLVKKGWMHGFVPDDDRVTALDTAFQEQFFELVRSHTEFDYGDEEIMAEYGSVICENNTTYLKIGSCKYKEVLYQNIGHKRASTEKLLKEFADKGGRIVKNVCELDPGIRFNAQKDVAVTVRTLDDDLWVFMMNLDNINRLAPVNIGVPEKYKNYNVEEWNLLKNESLGMSDLYIGFEKGQMRVFRFTKESVPVCRPANYKKLVLPDYMEYSLTEPNVLVIDKGTFAIDNELQNNGEVMDVLKIDRAVRDRYGLTYRGGEMVQPWFAKIHNLNNDKTFGKVSVTFTFDSSIEKEIMIACESADLIEFNGKILSEKSDFFWVDNCFDVYKAGKVSVGKNRVKMTYDFRQSTNIEGIYILGDFGVELPSGIVALPEKITPGDITVQGLPFYSGGILYRTGIKKGNYNIKFNRIGATIIHTYGTKKDNFITLSPYSADVEVTDELILEAVFTRRNTFGPFHVRPYPCYQYHPGSFVTEGDEWGEDYCVDSQGLELDG